MSTSRPIEVHPGMSLGDIYYVLFRHKWKIVIFSVAGLLAALALVKLHPPLYESQAELLIKYVPETRTMVLGAETIEPGSEVEDVINSEIQILTSLDVAEEAVTNLGASYILGPDGGNDPLAAAAVLQHGLHAEPTARGSSVILVTFRNPNSQIVQPVLQEIINDYFQKHYEIHQAIGQYDESMSRETADLLVQLNDIDKRLTEVKNRNNIISLEGTRDDLAAQIAKIQSEILDAEAQLGQDGVLAKDAQTTLSPKTGITTGNTQTPAAPPPDQVQAYQSIIANLNFLQKRQQSYVDQGFTPENVLVKEVVGEISNAQKAAAVLEQKYPQLALLNAAPAAPGATVSEAVATGQTQAQTIATLKAKIESWRWQEDQLWQEASNINNLAPEMAGLERSKATLETNYEAIALGLEQEHINEAMLTDKAPNIRPVQHPSAPFREWNKTYQRVAALACGGIILGLLLAFLTEMYLDTSVKRPVEVESRLKMPLFLSIPDVGRNGHSRMMLSNGNGQARLRLGNPALGGAPGTPNPDGEEPGHLEVIPKESNPALQKFFDALRDRLIVHFDVKNVTRKPKLVAVTGANTGAGVSTVAAGLAASLSKTGDGHVLLVDMNLENGAAQHFRRGKSTCDLETALATETQNDAQVEEHLYVVRENSQSEKLPRILPKRLSSLMPRLRESQYDYIIFDMPPVNQTSVTPRIARFMDMTLMIIESEKTDRDIVQRANKLLVESGANVSAVLNKTRQYVPKNLHQGYLGDS